MMSGEGRNTRLVSHRHLLSKDKTSAKSTDLQDSRTSISTFSPSHISLLLDF